ncbi:hypothetical protein METP3_02985 [Methanosarcinales archaeon]|nr:hypothetical protein METP3_02985 [Methanosarcinales archaeon]
MLIYYSSSMEKIKSWHVSIAAEAFAAGVFARCGYDVSVQYGANQPEYDLIIAKSEKILKVSVKGSQDGGWGLTQSCLIHAEYHKAADVWLSKHNKKTIFCFVQFEGIGLNELPRIYLATPIEVANRLKESAKGRGSSILNEHHKWGPKAVGAGTIDQIPDHWKFSKERCEELFKIA